MVLRSDKRCLIFSACKEIRTCDNGLEAELAACREGLVLALHRMDLPILIEMDSVEAVNMLNASTRDRSRNRVLVEEIKRMKDAETRDISFTSICRSQIKIIHALAAYGSTVGEPVLWYG